MKQCPYCNSEEGYYIKTQIRGVTEINYSFDGKYDEEHNSHIHDSLTYKDGKYTYCRTCNKRLTKVN